VILVMARVRKFQVKVEDLPEAVRNLSKEGLAVRIDFPRLSPEIPWDRHTAEIRAWRRRFDKLDRGSSTEAQQPE